MPILFLLIALSFLLSVSPASCEDGTPIFSEWGAPGLLQTPSARMPAAGAVATGVSALRNNHRHIFVGLSPTPWFWLGLRQSGYVNDYGLFEPGVDAAVRVAQEGPLTPAVAVGWRDGLGTGVHFPGVGRFAGEYVVASKRWWSIDVNAGVGWGRFAGRSAFGNPVFWGARDRPVTGPAARGPRNWFSGKNVGAFGGVTWRTPVDGLTIMAEYSADTRAAERLEGAISRKPSPLNIGAVWRPLSAPYDPLEIGVGFEGGRDLMLRALLRFGPEKLNIDGRAPPPPVPRPRAQVGVDVEKALPSAPFKGALPLFKSPPNEEEEEQEPRGENAVVWLRRNAVTTAPLGRDVGRGLRWLAAGGAPDADWLTVALRPAGLDGAALTAPREALLRAAHGQGSAEELLRVAEIKPASTAGAPPLWPWMWSGFSTALRFGFEESLFEHGAAQPLRGFVDLDAAWTPAPGAILGGVVRRNIANTLTGLNNYAFTVARPVRSDVSEYAYGTRVERLYLALRHSPTPAWHVGVDAGWLEEMFAGFGGEALHQPFGARWAVGAAAHRVWKRPAGQLFRLNYARGATTALAAAHYEGEGGVWSASVEAGRYLGGDWGGGLTFTRNLPGEAKLRAHAVLTDGPTPQQAWLGGKMEFGARLEVPLGIVAVETIRLLTKREIRQFPARFDTSIRTLGRDAGQKLDRPAPIYETLSAAGVGRLTGTWKHLLE